MPHTDDVPGAVLDIVARQVGLRLPRLLGSAFRPALPVTITATLAVWQLSYEQVEGGASDDLAALAVFTGRSHHQIAIDGQPDLYARSTLVGGEPVVEQVTASSTAKRIDAAIDWLDANGPQDDLARLLEAPAYLLRAIWLVNTGSVLVVEAARRLGRFELTRLYPESALLARMRDAGPVEGIRLP